MSLRRVQNYIILQKKRDICIFSDNDVRKDDDILVNGFKYEGKCNGLYQFLH